MSFEIATWYDTWNHTGLLNLLQGQVPLHYASRYNLAFGELVPAASGYTLDMNQKFAPEVLLALQTQAPDALIYAGIGDTGIAATVLDNAGNDNRSTANIIAYLQQQGLDGITIDAEGDGMKHVVQLVTQFGPDFKQAGLGIAVSAPWPGNGPALLYGAHAAAAFNQHVDAVELQNYSSPHGAPAHIRTWLEAGVQAAILMGGVCTENGNAQTSLLDTEVWTQFALANQLRGMFSWRLDNDHGLQGKEEDVEPTFTGAQTIYQMVQGRPGAS
jgi:hypothetical protein